jgi:hypothetical protein
MILNNDGLSEVDYAVDSIILKSVLFDPFYSS